MIKKYVKSLLQRGRTRAVFLTLSALLMLSVCPNLYAEEYNDEYYEEEEEDPIPESYYYAIESNDIKDWPQGPMIESAAATVMDMDTGAFLYSKNATAKMYPASTTKIMTTLLLVENCNLDDEIQFSEIVYDLEDGSSHLGIQPGEKLTLRQAAYGIMLASANDISNGVAEYMACSISGFADMMNARANELGCVNTHFSNPHGLYSDDHYTCAYDMALIAKAAYSNPVFREIAGTKEYTIPQTEMTDEDRSFLNHHKMMQKDSDHYREWCTGGKTGFTSQCLNTLVTFGEKDGQRMVSVVFRVNGADKAYEESTAILDYAFGNFHTELGSDFSKGRKLYDILGIRYFGDPGRLQDTAMDRELLTNSFIAVTYPTLAGRNGLIGKVTGTYRNTTLFSYEFNGQPVGVAEGRFRSMFEPVSLKFSSGSVSGESAGGTDLAADVTDKIQIEGLDDAVERTGEIVDSIYQTVVGFAEEHLAIVIAGGVALLILIIVFVYILSSRLSKDSRIQRRRMQEEKERRRREEEIERMTTAEIEAELRARMVQEQIRRAKDEKAQAEAERAALEAERLEAEAKETQELLEELERERQERLSEEERV